MIVLRNKRFAGAEGESAYAAELSSDQQQQDISGNEFRLQADIAQKMNNKKGA